MIDAEDVRRLGVGRWTVPLLALLAQEQGARFSRLATALGVSRDALTRTLDYVQGAGWVARHGGYGHPLRPEYVLTAEGGPVAAGCARMMEARMAHAIDPGSLPRWALPALMAMSDRRLRFSVLLAVLAPATPRALSASLKAMIAGGLARRDQEEGFPPFALYSASAAGRALAACLTEQGGPHD
jgi:DNA-binding HxlR family transcriptional regulator